MVNNLPEYEEFGIHDEEYRGVYASISFARFVPVFATSDSASACDLLRLVSGFILCFFRLPLSFFFDGSST